MDKTKAPPGNSEHLGPRSALSAHSPRRWIRPPRLGAIVVCGAGLTLGAFLSRVIAEIPWLSWPFYHWAPTVALTLALGIVLTLAWLLRTRLSLAPVAHGTWDDDDRATSFVPLYALALYLLQPAPNLLQAGVLLSGTLALFLLGPRSGHNRSPDPDKEWPIPLLLFGVSLVAYLYTLAPAVGTRDGYELQAASATLGIVHPTGYPLFPILGHLWIALFPLGSIAWRVNVLCALFAAASVPLVYGTARRVLGQRSFAVLSALCFGFSHTLWTQASQPEKYTLNALFVATILYVAFGIMDSEPKVPRRGPHPHFVWLGFVYGLSLTHHRTVLMLAPALAVYVLWRDPHLLKRPKEWVPALASALAPLLIYLYIPWRAHAQGWRMSFSEFLRYVSGAHYGPAVRLTDWLTSERSQMFWRFLTQQFGYAGVGLGLLGLVGLGLKRKYRAPRGRRFLICSLLAYFFYYFWGTVWYAYYNDVNSFIPNHLIFAIWIGNGAMTLWEACQGLWGTLRRHISRVSDHAKSSAREGTRATVLGARSVISVAVFLLPMWMIWTNAPQVGMSDVEGMTRWGEYVLSLDIAPHATILADRSKHPPLDYFARVERRRPDVDVVVLGDEQAYLDRLAWDLAREKPVYLARFLPGLEGPYHLRSLGPLVEVGTQPLTETGQLEGAPAGFGTGAQHDPHIELLGYTVENNDARKPGESLYMTLFWRTVSPVPDNYQVNLRLISSAGQEWWASSDHAVSGMYPTAAWKPGEVVPDWHEVPIADTLPPGTYTLEVGLFLPFSREGLLLADGGQWLPLKTITVLSAPPSVQIPHPLRAIAPGRWQLLGYDLSHQAPPAGRVPLTLYWQPLVPLPDYEIGTRLVTPQGEGEWNWAIPGHGEYPTSRWPARKTTVTTHLLTMPAETGQVTVQIAVRPSPPRVEETEGGLTFYPRWLAPRTTILSLPPVTVAGRPPATSGTVNYSDRILLLDTDLGQRALPPGAPLELAVHWQCIQAMDADYTLFIHVLAPDGTLKGQIDVWPKDGTHPTSNWREGEIIADTYLLYIDERAPPGIYQLEIGWYLLETMQRLPVLDAEGKAVDDKALLSGLTVSE